jgi:hypothetical protein
VLVKVTGELEQPKGVNVKLLIGTCNTVAEVVIGVTSEAQYGAFGWSVIVNVLFPALHDPDV